MKNAKKTTRPILASCLGLALVMGCGQGQAGDTPEPQSDPSGYGDQLGSVRLPASCAEGADPALERGLALLHHMTYEAAREAFAAAVDADPDCALGAWGQAMTFIHPLWSDPPSEADFERGRELLETARSRGLDDEREEAYVDAVQAYYEAGRTTDETPNLAAFAEAWARVHERFPDDPEATAFHALSHLATADPADKTYTVQREAGALAESVLAEIPDHPGGHHYTIHAYDYPTLAENALDVARSYGTIAPDVPHALHMPSHIFTRLGLWEESIEWNERSAEAAREHPVDGQVSMHLLHAIDYLAYAHLQKGADGKAREVADTLAALDGPIHPHVGSAYTLAAVPARLALERGRWAEAAAIEPRQPADFPWDRFPAIEAIPHFARALGDARGGDPPAAGDELQRLAELRDQAAESSDYWAQQVEIQRLAAEGWVRFMEGDRQAGLETMREAAELEASTEKHPVTPGEVLPARELLGDMLLELDRPEEALEVYEASLDRSPGRLNGLYGAGRAAELLGRDEIATAHYRELVDQAAETGGDLEQLAHAREYLDGTARAAGGP
ncbi:MAG: hypothetical protein ACLF0P_00840 [Thermoanaerobaculia bacterium]